MAGDPNAPLLGLLAVLAALGALLVGSLRDPEPTALTAVTGSVTVSVALVGSVLAVTEAGAAFGVSDSHALAIGVAVACAGTLLRHVPIVPAAALVLSPLALAAIVTSMAIHTGAPPWVAWARLASEPARVFPATATWVIEGRAVPRTTTVVFTESHRITALTTGVFRVTEPRPDGAAVREWRLSSGDSLTVRAGDHLTLTPGARLRFEAGKRIPGVAESGVAWAEPRARGELGALWDALGLAVTLAGGAVALLGASRGGARLGAVMAPLALFALVLGTTSWAVYAAWLTPDAALGASPLASIAAVPLTVTPPEALLELTAVIALAATSLLFATTANLVRRLDDLVAPWASRLSVRSLPLLLGAGALVSAVLLSWRGVGAEEVLRLGLGLGASAWAAPRLAGDKRGTMIGAGVGGSVFVGISLVAPLDLRGMAVLGAFPALVAAPLAAAVAVLARRRPWSRARVARGAGQVRVGCSEEGTLPQ